MADQLEPKLKPVGVKYHLAGQGDEDDHQDKPAAAAGAGCSPAKAKGVLKPIKEDIQH
jgi:hypothetical protein